MREALPEIFKILAGVAIPLAAFASGLRAAFVEPFWLLKRPGLLLRALLAILILAPVGEVIFLQGIAVSPVVRAGLTMAIVAIGIGPPAALKRVTSHEEVLSFEISLNVLVLVVSIVYLPAAVAVHRAFFHHNLHLGSGQVAKVVLTRALGPLLFGVVVARAVPRMVAPIGRYIGTFVQVALLVVVALALLASFRGLIGLGLTSWLACAAVGLAGIVIGHAAGGPTLETRRVLAAFSTIRFPALALLLASLTGRTHQLVPVILAYVLVSTLLVALYNALMTARGRRRGLPIVPAGALRSAPEARA